MLELRWEPLSGDLSPMAALKASGELRHLLQGWRGTRYAAGQSVRGVATSCIGFVGSIVRELAAIDFATKAEIPTDTAFHSPVRARSEMRRILRAFGAELEVVEGDTVQPADIVVTGPSRGGPAHLLVVGWRRNTLWEVGSHCVIERGWTISGRVVRVFRLRDRTRFGGGA